MTAPRVPDAGHRRGAEAQAAVHAARAGHLPGRRPHRRPGVNVTALADFIRNSAAAGFFGLYDALGGGLSRATVFALGIMPYISAPSSSSWPAASLPSIGKMQKDEEGRKKITQWTRYLTVFIALSQAYTFALFTESIPGAIASPGFALAPHHGGDPHHRRDLRHVAGRADHRARHRQRDEPAHHLLDPRAALAGAPSSWFSSSRAAWSARPGVVLFLVILVAVIAAVVAMTIAARRIPIQIPRKVDGRAGGSARGRRPSSRSG